MCDFLVIGGGIIGLLTARELAAGGGRVTLLERGSAGAEASWAGGGILSPLYPWRYPAAITVLAEWSQRHYPALCQGLFETTGIDPEHTRSGLLILDTQEQKAACRWADARGVVLRPVAGAAITALQPGLAATAGLWLPEVAQVRSPRLTRALRHDLGRQTEIIEGIEAQELMVREGRACGVRTAHGTLEAEAVVVCAGAWSGHLLARLGHAPDIAPVRGQMILFFAQPGDIRRIVLQQDRYAIPRRDGRVLFGSTLEHTGFDKRPTEEAREELYRRAVGLLPVLRRAAIERHWAGLRPGSPAGIPYIGAYPGIEGLYCNAGHFRNGLALAPVSARLLADIALGRPPVVPPGPYALDASRD
jgi:glycine oxidase